MKHGNAVAEFPNDRSKRDFRFEFKIYVQIMHISRPQNLPAASLLNYTTGAGTASRTPAQCNAPLTPHVSYWTRPGDGCQSAE